LGDVIAFDTGPGNMAIDAVVTALSRGKQTYDLNGRLAASGRTSQKLLGECLKHPFIRRGLPKTTGREEFGEPFVRWLLGRARGLRLSKADIVTTVTEFTAASIANAYRRFVLPKLKASQLNKLQVILGGGGAKNPTLVRLLYEHIGLGKLGTHEDFGMDSSAKEPLAFAILAHETLLGKPSNVPNVTGALRAVVLGKIVPA
jgi:anhydro-N-acetylmuramic acid kinase